MYINDWKSEVKADYKPNDEEIAEADERGFDKKMTKKNLTEIGGTKWKAPSFSSSLKIGLWKICPTLSRFRTVTKDVFILQIIKSGYVWQMWNLLILHHSRQIQTDKHLKTMHQKMFARK